MLTALEILTTFLRTNPDTDDIDRLVAMSAYMAKRLEADMSKPIEQLEAEVWPELLNKTTESDEGDSNDTVL